MCVYMSVLGMGGLESNQCFGEHGQCSQGVGIILRSVNDVIIYTVDCSKLHSLSSQMLRVYKRLFVLIMKFDYVILKMKSMKVN